MSKILEFFYSNKKRLIIIISIVSLLAISLFCFYIINYKYNKQEIEVVSEEIIKNSSQHENNEIEIETISTNKIYIDIKGEVMNPGVYEMNPDSRVIDAINLAGGLTDNAYTRYLNLSKKLIDENVIIVNNLSEIEEIKSAKNREVIIETSNTVSIDENEIITNDYEPIKDNKNDSEESLNTIVNINDATLEELTSLDGIGEATAKKIIEYREANNGFKSIEEILNVDGIGESKYAKIKESITIK